MSRCLISTKHQKVIFNRTKSPSPDKISDKDPSPPIFGTGYEQSQYQRHPLESDLKGTQRNSQLRREEEEGGDPSLQQQELHPHEQKFHQQWG